MHTYFSFRFLDAHLGFEFRFQNNSYAGFIERLGEEIDTFSEVDFMFIFFIFNLLTSEALVKTLIP